MPGGNGPRWARQDKPRDLRAAMTGLLVYMGRDRRSLYAGTLCALAATVPASPTAYQEASSAPCRWTWTTYRGWGSSSW